MSQVLEEVTAPSQVGEGLNINTVPSTAASVNSVNPPLLTDLTA